MSTSFYCRHRGCQRMIGVDERPDRDPGKVLLLDGWARARDGQWRCEAHAADVDRAPITPLEIAQEMVDWDDHGREGHGAVTYGTVDVARALLGTRRYAHKLEGEIVLLCALYKGTSVDLHIE